MEKNKIVKSKYSLKAGDIFGKLTIISYTDREGKKGEYKCLCECGNITYARTDALKKGKHSSCGCMRNAPRPERRLENNMAMKNSLLKNYKSSAKRRNHIFELSKDQFIILIEGNCHYCGAKPSNIQNSKNIINYEEYKYNGIDRVDNTLGYTLDNCVSCCAKCNMAKRDMSKDEFIEWIELAYNNIFKSPQRLSH